MSQLRDAIKRGVGPQEVKRVLNIRGADSGLDVSNFGGLLSSADDTVQKALDTLDDIDGSGLSAVVLKALFDANTILAANTDNTPAAVTVAEQRLVGRITGGNITALTAAQVITLLDITSSKLIFHTTLTASNDANLAWSSLPSTARRMILRLRNLLPATDDVTAHFTVTEGGTRQTGASDYEWVAIVARSGSTTIARVASTGDTKIDVAGSGSAGFRVDNAGSGVSGTIILENPASTTLERAVDYKTTFTADSADRKTENGNGWYATTGTAVDGFDFRFSTGNITSGEIDVYSEIGS